MSNKETVKFRLNYRLDANLKRVFFAFQILEQSKSIKDPDLNNGTFRLRIDCSPQISISTSGTSCTLFLRGSSKEMDEHTSTDWCNGDEAAAKRVIKNIKEEFEKAGFIQVTSNKMEEGLYWFEREK